jgi:hypothetical protein
MSFFKRVQKFKLKYIRFISIRFSLMNQSIVLMKKYLKYLVTHSMNKTLDYEAITRQLRSRRRIFDFSGDE